MLLELEEEKQLEEQVPAEERIDVPESAPEEAQPDQ